MPLPRFLRPAGVAPHRKQNAPPFYSEKSVPQQRMFFGLGVEGNESVAPKSGVLPSIRILNKAIYLLQAQVGKYPLENLFFDLGQVIHTLNLASFTCDMEGDSLFLVGLL